MVIPTCFSQPNTGSSSSQVPQSLVACTYQTCLSSSPSYLTLTWSKSFSSHSLAIYSANSFSITVSLYPSSFSLFRPRPSSKSIYLTNRHCCKVKLHYDFSRAKFSHNSAQPDSCFFIAISCDSKLIFFLGDLLDETEMTRKFGLIVTRPQLTEPAMLSRREHVFGRRNYKSRVQFMGCKHEIEIDCSGGNLKVKVDEKICLVVKRLAWKFRGNERIFIGGIEVEFFWDVFNWVSNNGGSNGSGCGVFVFQVGEGGVWPEVVGSEMKLMKKSSTSMAAPGTTMQAMMIPSLSPAPSSSSILQWAEESSDGGRSSCSSSTRYSGYNCGFSLLLYAWREEI